MCVQKVPYVEAIENAGIMTAIAWELPPFYYLGRFGAWLGIPAMQKLFHANETLAERGRAAIRTNKEAGHTSSIFNTIINEGDKEEGGTLSQTDVQFEASNLILAGTDTTGNTLTYLTWVVLARPALRQAVEEELANVPVPYTDAALELLPILSAVIEETLRLYCAAPGSLPRTPPKGGATLGGYYVPEGTTVSTQAYSLHRDPTLFPDPTT